MIMQSDYDNEMVGFSGMAELTRKEREIRAERMKVIVLCALSFLTGLAVAFWR